MHALSSQKMLIFSPNTTIFRQTQQFSATEIDVRNPHNKFFAEFATVCNNSSPNTEIFRQITITIYLKGPYNSPFKNVSGVNSQTNGHTEQ